MRKQFELRLCNYTLFAWLGFTGMMASIALAALAVGTSAVPKGNLQFLLLLVVGGSGFYGTYWLLKTVAVSGTLLTVEPDCLTIHYTNSAKTLVIPFDEVVSYRDEFLRDGRELRFRLQSGHKVKLAVNSFLGDPGDYDEFMNIMQLAMQHYSGTHALVIAREKSFFEKPIATVLLVVCSLAVLLAIGDMVIGHKPFKGSFLVAIGSLLSYIGMWRAARMRQKQS